jgi:hypothetical protein
MLTFIKEELSIAEKRDNMAIAFLMKMVKNFCEIRLKV